MGRVLSPAAGPHTLQLRRWIVVFVGATAAGTSAGVAPAIASAVQRVPALTLWPLMLPVLILPLLAGAVAAVALSQAQRRKRVGEPATAVETRPSPIDRTWQAMVMAVMIGYGAEVALTGAIPLIPSLSGTDTVIRDTPLISYFPIVGIAGSSILTPRANGLCIVTLVPALILMLATSRGALTEVSVEQPLLLLVGVLMVTGMLHWMLDQGRALDRASAERRRQAVSLAADHARSVAQRRSNSFVHDHILSVLVSLAAGLEDSAQLRQAARSAVESLEPRAPGRRPATSASALFEALTTQIRSLSPEARLAVSTAVDHPVPAAVSQALADAAMEALRNSLRHAGGEEGPGSVERRIEMRSDAEGVAVVVSDDGRGFDPAAPAPGRHGLTGSIGTRLHDAGATARIRSAPGHGTAVSMTWAPSAGADQRAAGSSGAEVWPRSVASAVETVWARLIGVYAAVIHIAIAALEIRSGAYSTAVPVVASLAALALAAFLLLRSWPRASMPRWAVAVVLLIVPTTHLAVMLPIRTSGWPGFASWVAGAANAVCCCLLLRQRPRAAWAGELLLVATAVVWVVLSHRSPLILPSYLLPHAIALILWHLAVNRCTAASAAIAAAQARTAEVLALRQANMTADRIMRQAMESVRRRTSPLLGRVAAGEALTPQVRTRARLLEAELRDEIRAPFFTGTPVVRSAREARARGTDVILMDDRGDSRLPSDIRRAITDSIVEVLADGDQARVVVRVLPAGRPQLVSILTDTGVTILGPDGRPAR